MSPLLFLSKKKKKKYAFNVSGSLSLFPFTDNSSSLPPSGIRQTSPSSAPWVTYINPVVSAPHIDTSQRIRQTSRWWQSTADMEMCHRERLHLFMHSKEDRPAIQCMSLPEHWASPNSPFTKATTHPLQPSITLKHVHETYIWLTSWSGFVSNHCFLKGPVCRI